MGISMGSAKSTPNCILNCMFADCQVIYQIILHNQRKQLHCEMARQGRHKYYLFPPCCMYQEEKQFHHEVEGWIGFRRNVKLNFTFASFLRFSLEVVTGGPNGFYRRDKLYIPLLLGRPPFSAKEIKLILVSCFYDQPSCGKCLSEIGSA